MGSPSDRSPRGGTKAVLTPQGCRAARRSGTRRPGTLAAPGAAAARRLPQHGESSSTRIWTEAMEVRTTSMPNGHHLPPIPDAGPRGPAPSGRTSPPFPRQPSQSDRQRFTRTPTRQQTERPARPPPPSQGRRPARCLGDSTPRTHGQGDPRPTNGLHKGWVDNPPNAPPRERGAVTPSRTQAPATRPTGAVHHGVPQPSCNTAKPPGRGGRTATAGARRERPRSGRRNDRDLWPSEVW